MGELISPLLNARDEIQLRIRGGQTARILAGQESPLIEQIVAYPFRFSNEQQAYLRSYADQVRKPRDSTDWNNIVVSSQNAEFVLVYGGRYLAAADNAIKNENGETPDSELKLIQAGNILRNITWESGSHLAGAVESAGLLLGEKMPVIAQEAAAGAIKNAAWFEGPHIQRVAEQVALARPGVSVRVFSDLVRAIDYASRHTAEILHNSGVRSFLVTASGNGSEFVAQNARDILAKNTL